MSCSPIKLGGSASKVAVVFILAGYCSAGEERLLLHPFFSPSLTKLSFSWPMSNFLTGTVLVLSPFPLAGERVSEGMGARLPAGSVYLNTKGQKCGFGDRTAY